MRTTYDDALQFYLTSTQRNVNRYSILLYFVWMRKLKYNEPWQRKHRKHRKSTERKAIDIFLASGIDMYHKTWKYSDFFSFGNATTQRVVVHRAFQPNENETVNAISAMTACVRVRTHGKHKIRRKHFKSWSCGSSLLCRSAWCAWQIEIGCTRCMIIVILSSVHECACNAWRRSNLSTHGHPLRRRHLLRLLLRFDSNSNGNHFDALRTQLSFQRDHCSFHSQSIYRSCETISDILA